MSGRLPAWRRPRVRETSPAVVPNRMSVDPMSGLVEVVPKSEVTRLPRRQVSSTGSRWCRSESWLVGKHWDTGGGGDTSAEVEVVVVVVVVVVVGRIVDVVCFAWFSEKRCLLIAMSEGSPSGALISDLLPVVVVVVGSVIDAVVAAAPPPPPAAAGVVGVCARPLLCS